MKEKYVYILKSVFCKAFKAFLHRDFSLQKYEVFNKTQIFFFLKAFSKKNFADCQRISIFAFRSHDKKMLEKRATCMDT